MRKIKIAFIAHDCSLYGAQRSLLTFLLKLDRERFEPIVVLPYEGPFADIVRQAGIPCYLARMSRWIPLSTEKDSSYGRRFMLNAPRRIYSLIKLLYFLQVDLVYTNTVVNCDGALAAKLLGKKHIWHLREGVRGNRQLSSCVNEAFLPAIIKFFSKRVIVNSKWLGHHFFKDDLNSEVVYNGIDFINYNNVLNGVTNFRSEMGISKASKIIVSIGSIDRRKCHDVFIDALKAVISTFENVYAFIIGDGDGKYKTYLESLVKAYSLEERIFFLGFRDDVAKIIFESDLLVVASEQEAFGRTLLEGMALKKPIIATRSGGPEEIIIDGETGYLVPVRDPVALGNRIIELISNDRLAEEFGIAGYERFANLFNERIYVSRLENIISEVFYSS